MDYDGINRIKSTTLEMAQGTRKAGLNILGTGNKESALLILADAYQQCITAWVYTARTESEFGVGETQDAFTLKQLMSGLEERINMLAADPELRDNSGIFNHPALKVLGKTEIYLALTSINKA